eukprot:609337-Rhodomonas_salina.3
MELQDAIEKSKALIEGKRMVLVSAYAVCGTDRAYRAITVRREVWYCHTEVRYCLSVCCYNLPAPCAVLTPRMDSDCPGCRMRYWDPFDVRGPVLHIAEQSHSQYCTSPNSRIPPYDMPVPLAMSVPHIAERYRNNICYASSSASTAHRSAIA